ncbi:MAG: PEP-CTERM sorting domain-containing protein [Patescibacteria group bacterium]|nr:PEP-CTERM sorting domain-containing protein [Patescibacteria group bacterium]
MNIKRSTFAVPTLAAVLVIAAGGVQAAVVFDFDWNPTLNSGRGDGQNAQGWEAVLGGEHSVGFSSGTGAGGRGARGTGTYDQVHNGVLFVSPEFVLDATSTADLTFELSGGRGRGGSSWGTNAPTSRQAVIDQITTSSGLSSNTGMMGIALRRVSTGEYVLVKERSTSANTWESYGFTRAELDNLISTHGANEVYSLEFMEYFHGSWGHVELDNVSIPGRVLEARIQNSGFEETMLTRDWNTFYADTVRTGEWYAPLFSDRMQVKTEPNGNKYLGHNVSDPNAQGTFAYQAVNAPAFGSAYELSFDYFNENGTGGSAEDNMIHWAVWGFADPVPNAMFNNGNIVSGFASQHSSNLLASGEFLPGDTDGWTTFLTEFDIPAGLERLVIGIGDSGVRPVAEGDLIGFDNVILRAVPEPSAALMALMAMAALATCFRKR